MKVCVVGGAGYLGTELISKLLNDGFEVLIIDLNLWGGIDELYTYFPNPNIKISKIDVNNLLSLTKSIESFEPSILYWAVGLVGAPVCQKFSDIAEFTNIQSIKNYVEISIKRNHRKFLRNFIFISSCSVFGNTKGILDVADEGSPTNPLSIYAEHKLEIENFLLNHEEFNQDIILTIPRITTLYGLSIKPRFDLFLNLFCLHSAKYKKINVNGGEQLRSMIHVRDVASALRIIPTSDKNIIKKQIYHIGNSEHNYKVIELAKVVADISGCELNLNNTIDDQRSYKISSDKLKDQLNWAASENLRDGLEELIEFSKNITSIDNPNYFNINFDYSTLY